MSSSTLSNRRNSPLPICIFVVLLIPDAAYAVSTKMPVIGGKCEIGTADVHIGGKQTQFFLKCEAAQGSERGSGVWVVKSRAASPPQSVAEHQPRNAVISSVNTESQLHARHSSKYPPNICVQDLSAREADPCTVPMTCLQQNVDDASTFLQCDQNNNRWVKRSCSDGQIFNFEQQSCIMSIKQNYHRYVAPCSLKCPIGYACVNNTCIALAFSHLCIDGSAPRGSCSNDASCPPSYRCTAQSLCCPKTNVYCSVQNQCVVKCPSHKFCSSLTACCRPLLTDGGSCTSSRQCLRGLVCSRGRCLQDVLPKFLITAKCGILSTCTNDIDCAMHMKCSGGCCLVGRCPSGYPHTSILVSCTHQLQCPQRTNCYAGRCCPLAQFNETTHTDTNINNSDLGDRDLLLEEGSTSAKNVEKSWKAFDESRVQTHECPQGWGSICSLADPCQDGSDCIMGRCCRIPEVNRLVCSNGHSALSLPHECAADGIDCPLGSSCQRNRCCTNANNEQSNANNTHSTKQRTRLFSNTDSAKRNANMASNESGAGKGVQRTQEQTYFHKTAIESRWSNADATTKQLHVFNRKLDKSRLVPKNISKRRFFDHGMKHSKAEVNSSTDQDVFYERRLCPDAMESLSTPALCNASEHCPSGYTCQRGVCCKPLECMHRCKTQHRYDDNCTQSVRTSSTEAAPTGIQTTSMHQTQKRVRCLEDSECEFSKMCPDGYTCLRDGQCCELTIHCTDGTIPLHECLQGLCPSSSDVCVHIDSRSAICCTDHNIWHATFNHGKANNMSGHQMKLKSMSASTPSQRDTTFAAPRMPLLNAHRCKFSIECPPSHYCDLRGFCWPLQTRRLVVKRFKKFSKCDCKCQYTEPLWSGQVPLGGQGGLVCVYMQCSNLNPCSQGTCNNGYCCTPSAISSSASAASPILLSPSNFGTLNLAALPSAQLIGSAIPFSQAQSPSCTSGCPRGYSGCCGTQEPSCCPRQMCPGGLPSTGRPCFNSCPTGQICVAGVCCLQVGGGPALSPTTCPSGGLPFGRCMNGLCSAGYACNPSNSMCCPQIAQFAQIPQNAVQPAQIPQSAVASVCPAGGIAAGSCINGLCGTGFSCIAPSNLCCPLGTGLVRPATNPFVCPDGTQAAGACINGMCGTGFSCTGGLCCNATSQNPRCLDGSQAVGACINGMCGAGFTCTTGNVCCPSTSVVTAPGTVSVCPNGAASAGPCVNNLCPAGFTCINNQCCPSTTTTTTCTNPAAAIGACLAGNTCADGGFACDTALNLCCPRVTAIGPCVGGACPAGFTCFPAGTTATSQCYQTCAGTGTVVGPPINANLCPAGTRLVFGECCQTARYRAPTLTSFLSENHLDSLQDSVGTCVDGSAVISGCINGACGGGFECLDNFCCSRMTNNELSFSPHSTRPIGVECETSEECVGFTEGLSTCEMSVCRCKPIAQILGKTCVRNSHSLQFNDAMPIEEENATTATNSTQKEEQKL